MLDHFPFYLGITVVILLLIMLANKLKIAYPILLVLAGLCISLIEGIPNIVIEPELIFIIFLPPLLYEASWSVSWKELWRWRRIIFSLAFIVVFLTALSVAYVANHFIPGFSLALGFLLGGIVSPPDAVSAGAILKFVKIPKSVAAILEGESLLNDASSLIICKFAMIAVATGQFLMGTATWNFGWMVLGGVAVGLGMGWIIMKLHKWLPTDSNMDIIISFITPYFMYLLAEELESSGVLAVVIGGLYLANNRHHFLDSSSRIKAVNVWESFVFMLNGLVFMLIGLDLPQIVSGLGETNLSTAIGYGILITVVLIFGRLLSSYGALIFTMLFSKYIKTSENRHPGYKLPFILGWTGMRGVVSLAAALSIPLYMADGSPFPQRNLIQFITFVVILLTLVIQGLSLPYFIKKMKIDYYDTTHTKEESIRELRHGMAQAALEHLKEKHPSSFHKYPALQNMADKWEHNNLTTINEIMVDDCKIVYLDLLNKQRQYLLQKNKSDLYIDETHIRSHLRLLDLEEEKLKHF